MDGETAIEDDRYDENINERSADNSDRQQPFDDGDDDDRDSDEDEDDQMDYDVDERADTVHNNDRIRYRQR